MPIWTFDRAQRLTDLARRCEALDAYLRREKADSTDPAYRAILDGRRAILQARRRRLLDAARCLRRDRRLTRA